MARKKPQLTPLEKEYRKEYRRVTQAIRRQVKRGYVVSQELMPIRPSNLKKSEVGEQLFFIRKLTPSYIRYHSGTVDPKTGEYFGPEYTGDVIPPKESNLNMQIIADITQQLEEFTPRGYWRPGMIAQKTATHATLSLMWQEALDLTGAYELAYRLEGKAEEIHRAIDKLLYDSGSNYNSTMDMGTFTQIIFGKPLTQAESDYYSDYGQAASMEALGYKI